MMVMVPVMVTVTLSLTFLVISQAGQEELSMTNVIANDFTMIHEWRVSEVERLKIRDGQVRMEPGYPFNPFYQYYTEVIENDQFLAVVTWPLESNGHVQLPGENDKDLLASLEARLNRGFYSGNFQSYGPGGGGRLAAFDLIGLDLEPDNGDPVLLKIFSKDVTE